MYDTATTTFTEARAAIGFRDSAGRFYPLAFTPERVEILKALGIDLAAAVGDEQALLDLLLARELDGDGEVNSALRMLGIAFVCSGGYDEWVTHTRVGIRLGDVVVSGEELSASIFFNAKTPECYNRMIMAVVQGITRDFPGAQTRRILAMVRRLL